MTQFLGEYDCTLDTKGRLRLPSLLLKQLGAEVEAGFVMHRGLESCVVMYTEAEWMRLTEEIQRLNMYVKKHRQFARYFFRGATRLRVDKQERVLLPKRLLGYAGLEKEVVLLAYLKRIEFWDKARYETMLDEEPMDFADLAEDIMGLENAGGISDVS